MIKFILTFLLFSATLPGQTWQQLADFPDLGRDDGVAVNTGNLLYFGTGLKSDWSYGRDFYTLDPGANTWSPIASMPIGTQRQYACAFPGPGCFFVFAGDGPGGALNDLYKYTVAGNSWSQVASKPGNGLIGATCMEFGDKIIIVGGKAQGGGPAGSEVWEYTISTDSWLQKNNFPYGGRFRSSAAAYNGIGYLVFGIDHTNKCRREMYSYDPANDSWALLPDFPEPYGRAYASLKTTGDKLMLFGGYDSLNTYYKNVWYFKPATGSWQQDADFPSFARRGGMSMVVGDKFLYSCGINAADQRIKETWMLDLPVGIKNHFTANEALLHPNPFTDVLFFESSLPHGTSLRFEILDPFGREVESVRQRNDRGVIALGIGHLPAGVYLVRIYNEEKLVLVKQVIKS
jgi:N-acetylneuraminic acid mutarotase